jgi:small redox-active disulfide protein 2
MSQDFGYVNVGGRSVGIAGLEAILREVVSLQMAEEGLLKAELLRRVRRGNYVPASAEMEYAEALLREYNKRLGQEVNEEPGVLTIKILGPGCASCERLASEVRSVLAKLQLPANVEHVRDPMAIARYGLLATPALIIAGQVRASGSVPSSEKMKKWLEEFC